MSCRRLLTLAAAMVIALSGISEETEFNASVYAENGTRLANTTGTVGT